MNNEQGLLNEAYENYEKNAVVRDVVDSHYEPATDKWHLYNKEEFINKCKTDTEFSQRWGLKIEERELSLEERYDLIEKDKYTQFVKWQDYGTDRIKEVLDEKNVPTKLITVTRELSYDERFKIAYKNLELRKKLEAESAMLHYPSGHIKVMDDNNIPTNKTIESYE